MKSSMQKLSESKIKMIDQKIESIFMSIDADYKRGVIQSESEFSYKLLKGLIEFYGSIGLPTYKFRAAMAAPDSTDYNSMMKEFIEDISTIFKEYGRTIEMLEKSFEAMEQERELIQSQLRYIAKKADNLYKQNRYKNMAVEVESFMSSDTFDSAMCNGTPVNINTVEGLITLALKRSVDVTPLVNLKIDDKSNGFPGSTHVVSYFEDAIRFDGEDSMNADAKSIVDSDNATWFEYESFKVGSAVYDEVDGYGFEYKEGLRWITEDNELMMKMELLINEAVEINWLSLSPFLPEHKGAVPAYITEIIVDDTKGTRQSLLKGPVEFSNDIVIPFQKQVFKKVFITIMQPMFYEIEIGHMNYKEVLGNQSIFDTEERTRNIEGPLPSIQNIGMFYNPSSGKYEQPDTSNSIQIQREKAIKDLFQPKQIQGIIGSVNTIHAKRYHIGIRNISLLCNEEFALESEFISNPINTSSKIVSVKLEAQELLPYGITKEMLEYYISINDGESWHLINPINRAMNGAAVYKINTQTPNELKQSNVGYIDWTDDVYSLRYKIVMKRPEDNQGISPVVQEVKVYIETGGNVNEY